MTRSDVGKGHPEYYQDMAERIAARDAGRLLRQPVRQPGQSAGARDHHRRPRSGSRWSTRSTPSSAASARAARSPGSSRFFARVAPTTEMVLADPAGSVLARATCKTGNMIGRPAPGWSRASARTSCRRSPTSRASSDAYTITDAESLATARELLQQRRHPGRLVVRHAGRRGAALLPRADDAQSASSRFVCDSGNKYLSKMFNDYWMPDQGFLERETRGDLRDLVIAASRRQRRRSRVAPDDTLLTAYARMKLYDVSQLPVLRGRQDRRHRRRVRPAARRSMAATRRVPRRCARR